MLLNPKQTQPKDDDSNDQRKEIAFDTLPHGFFLFYILSDGVGHANGVNHSHRVRLDTGEAGDFPLQFCRANQPGTFGLFELDAIAGHRCRVQLHNDGFPLFDDAVRVVDAISVMMLNGVDTLNGNILRCGTCGHQ